MDDFLNYLIKKSNINNNEYFNYRKPYEKKKNNKINCSFLDEPTPNSYVVFDLETTGMNYINNKIIEIGAVKILNDNIVGTFNQLINPECYISSYISNIVHITNDMVCDKPTISEVMPYFIDFIENLPLVAHNARFDMGFLNANAERLGFIINNKIIDTLKLSRKYNKECEKHNLGYLTKYFNISLDNAHRAYFDALATYKLYRIIQHKFNSMLKNS